MNSLAWSLPEKTLFQTQSPAIVQVAQGRNVRVMLSMVIPAVRRAQDCPPVSADAAVSGQAFCVCESGCVRFLPLDPCSKVDALNQGSLFDATNTSKEEMTP